MNPVVRRVLSLQEISMIRTTFFSLTVALVVGLAPSTVFAQKKAAQAQDDARMLSLEVVALQTLHRLDPTTPQLEGLLRLNKGSASTPAASGTQKVTPAFVKTLKALRNALAAEDEDSIDELKEKLHEIMDKDKIVLDDRVPLSDAARRGAPLVIRSLTPGQVLAYVQILDEDDVDPLDMLEAALDRGKSADAAAWKAIRDSATAEAAWLLAGSDEMRSRPVAKLLAAILDQQRSAQKAKVAGPDLEKQLQQLTAQVDPLQLVRHAMERELAELLSNPCLPSAIQHTLEQRRKLAVK
jgi:hypothetical protein